MNRTIPSPRLISCLLLLACVTEAHAGELAEVDKGSTQSGLKRFYLPGLRRVRNMVVPVPFNILVDGQHLYFSVGSSRTPLYRMPRPGGPMTLLVPPGYSSFLSSPVIWQQRLFARSQKKIVSLPKQGGTPQVEFSFPNTLSLGVHNDQLYRTKFKGRVIERLDVDRKRPKRIARFSSSPSSLHFDGRWIYTSLYRRGQVVRVPQRGGPAKVLVSGQRRVVDCIVLGEHIYWSVEGNQKHSGMVRRRNKTGRGKIETLVAEEFNAEVFVSHGGSVYWRSWLGRPGQHRIMRYNPKNKKLTVAVGGLHGPSGFTFDDKYIYICEKGTGAIARAPKPKD